MLSGKDIELIKKGVLAGIGFGALTAEKAQKVISDLIKKGEVNKEEGKKIARKLMAESKEYRKVLTENIAKEVKKSVMTVIETSKKETERLAKRIRELESSKKQNSKPKKKAKKR